MRRGGEEEARTRRTQMGIAQRDHTMNPGGHEEVRASIPAKILRFNYTDEVAKTSEDLLREN